MEGAVVQLCPASSSVSSDVCNLAWCTARVRAGRMVRETGRLLAAFLLGAAATVGGTLVAWCACRQQCACPSMYCLYCQ